MHANKVFWNSTSVPPAFTAMGSSISGSTVLSGTVASNCTTASCTPAEMAANDVQKWVAEMYLQFPTYTAKVDCSVIPPVSCEIYVTFSESKVAISKGTEGGSNSQTESFSVFVKP